MTAKSLEDLTVPELVAHARTLEQRTSLFDTLLNSPDTREEALKLVKKKNPAMPIPELDNKTAIEAQLATERAAREALEKRVVEGDIRARYERERARVKKDYNFSDADLLEVEKLMVDEKAPIPHIDGAAKVFRASKVQATPTPISVKQPRWTMPEKDIWAGGVGNAQRLNQIALSQAELALNEIAGTKAA